MYIKPAIYTYMSQVVLEIEKAFEVADSAQKNDIVDQTNNWNNSKTIRYWKAECSAHWSDVTTPRELSIVHNGTCHVHLEEKLKNIL